MAIGQGSGVRYARVAEVTWATTPSTPTFLISRVTGGGMRTNKSTGTSNEIRADRNVSDEFQLGQDAAGSVNFELTYGTFDTPEIESLLQSTWSTNVIKNGITTKSFTWEETIEMGATDNFFRFPGTMANSMSLSVPARGAVTGSWGLMAQKELSVTSIVSGATYTAANTKAVMTGVNAAALSVLGGSSYKVRSLSLEVTNNLRTRPVIGDLYSAEFGAGRFEVTGNAEVYFEAATLYDSVLSHGSGALTFTLGSVTAEKYTFLLPKIFLGNGERRTGGNDDDVMVNIPFRAVYDTSEACTLKITRAVA